MAHRLLVKCRVLRRREIAPGMVEIVTAPEVRPAMPPFEPGAHVNVRVPGRGLRAYSIASEPADLSSYALIVKREPEGRGGSGWLHGLGEGDRLLVSHPESTLRIAEGAAGHLMIAGGIGVTPYLAMLPALARAGAPHALHLALREGGHWPDHPALRGVAARGVLTLHRADAGGPRLDAAALLAALPEGWHAYLCGPERLMAAARAAAEAAGVADRLHEEHFAGVQRAEALGEPFAVEIPSRRARVEVPADRTAAEALRAAGQPVAVSCEGGVCRTCVTAYRSGDPIHRDRILSPEERRGAIALCVSRARGTLVLDL